MNNEQLNSWKCQTCKCNARLHVSKKMVNTPAPSLSQSNLDIAQSSKTEDRVVNLLSPSVSGLDLDTTIDQSAISGHHGGVEYVNAVRGNGIKRDLDWTYAEDHGLDTFRQIVREELASVIDEKLKHLLDPLLQPICDALHNVSYKIEEFGENLNKLEKRVTSLSSKAASSPYVYAPTCPATTALYPVASTTTACPARSMVLMPNAPAITVTSLDCYNASDKENSILKDAAVCKEPPS